MAPVPRFDHLAAMTTADGLFEHALHDLPRPEHGYCLDDVARGLVVVAREPGPTLQVRGLVRSYLDFVTASLDERGQAHNRRSVAGAWTDTASTHDHWGRGVWALGVAAAFQHGRERDDALAAAALAMRARSPWLRATAYAALGAAEVLRVVPGDRAALDLLTEARTRLATPARDRRDRSWPWPEPRLTYANAVIPEALLAIGWALDDEWATRRGLALLGWLVDVQQHGGHLSVIPAGGWGPGEERGRFDQQPIEVTALAEACHQALALTGEPRWSDALEQCADWFLGANDAGLVLYDVTTGGCADGLHPDRVNLNRGAESTLAALATLQRAREVLVRS